MPELKSQLTEITAASGATLTGIALQHLESGEEILINAHDSFPMASVLKIPVLVEAFRQIEEGKFTLDDRWPLTAAEKNIGSGILTYMQDGLQPTVRDLLTLMIIISDNTATDVVINRLGVAAIQQTMRDLGLQDIHFVMSIRGLFEKMLGAEGADPARLFVDLDQPKTMIPNLPDTTVYDGGPHNNTSTPYDMTRLVAKIYRGEAISRIACDGMLHILLQQQLNGRLPLFLPYGIPFAHKTGTLSGIRNDAGILYCNEQNHVAITVFTRWDAAAVKGDKVAEWQQINAIDGAFGQIGRAVYEYYQ